MGGGVRVFGGEGLLELDGDHGEVVAEGDGPAKRVDLFHDRFDDVVGVTREAVEGLAEAVGAKAYPQARRNSHTIFVADRRD